MTVSDVRFGSAHHGSFEHGGEINGHDGEESAGPWRPVWHYNQTAQEGPGGKYNQIRSYGGRPYETWPADAAYPDFFLFGDPYINFYEGSARYDDRELWLPEEAEQPGG